MTLATRLLENSAFYRAWQAPFGARKFAPILAHNDLASVRRVLDVGCGPGTNTAHFGQAEYLGIDINPAYIADARRRYGREYIVADVTTYAVSRDQRFDFILANSLFHHIETDAARRVLANLATLLTPDGHIHILDLILPDHPSVGRVIARMDRGEHPRRLADWQELLSEHFRPVIVAPYRVGAGGITLWNMLYFKGQSR